MKTQVIRQVTFVNSNAEILFTTISVVTGAHQCVCDVISIFSKPNVMKYKKIMEEILTLIQTLSSFPRFADRYIRCTLIDSVYHIWAWWPS